MFRTLWLSLVGILLTVSGCSKKTVEVGDLPSQPVATRAAVKLNVLVIDDEKLAAGINLLRGEWSERSGGQIEVAEMSTDEFLAAEKLAADLVIYPSRYVGTLVGHKWLRVVRETLLTNPRFGFSDLLPLVRNRSIRFGEKIYGLSLGSPPLMIACPSDSLPLGGINLQTGLPLRSPHLRYRWAVESLVRGVSYTELKNDPAVLFDPQSMKPRIESPPFAKGLDEMLTVYRSRNFGKDNPFGIAWPTSHSYETDGAIAIQFLPFPKAPEVYRASRGSWEVNEATGSVTMLGFSGRSVSVLRASRNSASAFKLLVWLTSGEPAIQLSQRSDATIWFRTSQVSQSQKWLDRKNAAEGVAAEVTALLSGENCFLLPRIPGIDDYLQTLDHQIELAVHGEQSARETLALAAEQWQAITKQLGTQKQRAAYRQHLGFADLAE